MKKLIKKSIQNALVELCNGCEFDKITIKDICERADISKPTFYKYYKDKYEVAAYIYLSDTGLTEEGSLYFTYDNVMQGLTAIIEHRAFYKNALSSKSQNSLYGFIAEHAASAIRSYVVSASGRNLSEEEGYRIDHYCYGWAHCLNDWVEGKTPYTKKDLAKYQINSVPEFIRELV